MYLVGIQLTWILSSVLAIMDEPGAEVICEVSDGELLGGRLMNKIEDNMDSRKGTR